MINKSKIAKKARSLLFRDKEVVAKKKHLKQLKDKIREIIECKLQIGIAYNDILDTLNMKGHHSFPLENMSDISAFNSGHKNDYKLPMLKLHADLRKEFIKASEEIENLSKEVRVSEIDLLLAKSECIQRKME